MDEMEVNAELARLIQDYRESWDSLINAPKGQTTRYDDYEVERKRVKIAEVFMTYFEQGYRLRKGGE